MKTLISRKFLPKILTFSGVAALSLSEARIQAVSFSLPITEYHFELYIKNPANSINYKAYIEPLDSKLWILIGMFTLTTPIFMFFITK